jgi:hypothetical protein
MDFVASPICGAIFFRWNMDIKGLYPIQAMVVAALLKHRRLLLMLPRQEGKTEVGVRINRFILDTDKTRTTMFLAKNKKSAQKASREKIQRLFEPALFKVNTENIVNKKNPNATGIIESCDKDPDRMRGGTMHYIHWSEVAFANIESGQTIIDVATKILLPMTRKTNGFMLFESTANGENEWKDLWEDSMKIMGAHTLRVSLSMLFEMGMCSKDEYYRIKDSTHPLVFRQEYENEFVKFSGLIYDELQEYMCVPFDLPDKLNVVGIGIDWGFIDASCMLAGYRYKGKFWIFDEIYHSKMLLEEFANMIKAHTAMWDAQSIGAVADHEPDRIEELQRRGIPCGNADKSNVLGCRIQIKELLWKDEIRIHPRCKNLLRDLKSISWNEKIKGKREDADYDECSWGHYDAEAALRYLIRNLIAMGESSDEEFDFTNGMKAGLL